MAKYRLNSESQVKLEEAEATLDRLYRELLLHIKAVKNGKKVALLRTRKASINLAKFLKEFRKLTKEVEFEPDVE